MRALDSNPYAAAARERKAAAIAIVLRDHGVTADDAEFLDAIGRGAACQLAGQHPASDETWARVVDLLRTPRPADDGDPFRGFPA